jgi:hypothetical protein
MHAGTAFLLAGILSLFTTGESHAQDRGNLWAAGLAVGYQEVDGRHSRTGVSGHVSYSDALNDILLLGGEASVWINQGSTSIMQSSLNAVATIYPVGSADLFIKLGLGLAYLTEDSSSGRENDFGLGLVAGLGYDIVAGDALSIRPFINVGGGAFPGASTTLLEFGVGVSWP